MVEKEEVGGSRKESETGKNVINVREEEEFEESQCVAAVTLRNTWHIIIVLPGQK